MNFKQIFQQVLNEAIFNSPLSELIRELQFANIDFKAGRDQIIFHLKNNEIKIPDKQDSYLFKGTAFHSLGRCENIEEIRKNLFYKHETTNKFTIRFSFENNKWNIRITDK